METFQIRTDLALEARESVNDFFANFLFVYSVHIFCFYSQKMFHTTQKSHLPDEITFYVFIW